MTYCKVFRGIRFHFAYALPQKPIISLQSVTFYKSVFEHTRFCGLQKKSAKPITASRNDFQITV